MLKDLIESDYIEKLLTIVMIPVYFIYYAIAQFVDMPQGDGE